MREVYVLVDFAGVHCIADDFERCNMELAKFSEARQAGMKIETHNVLEDGD